MRIGICDDDRLWCERAKRIIESYGKQHRMVMQIFLFMTEESLMEYEGAPFDVLFCDIDLYGQNSQVDCSVSAQKIEKEFAVKNNGITMAQKINHRWPHCLIIYVTNYLYYATEVYQTKHSFFVLKDQFEHRLEEIFEMILRQLKQEQDRLLFSLVGGGQVLLTSSDIYYFERNGRTTNIVTKHGTYCVHEKLGDLINRLPQDVFSRCHNSYIIYLPAVREMEKGSYILTEGTQINISRSYAKKTKEMFMKWALQQFI